MLKKVLILLSFVIVLDSCGDGPCCGGLIPGSSNAKAFGVEVAVDNAMPYDQLLAEMATADSMQVRVSGKVSDVCQMSGCWLDVQSESGGPGMHVTFKNEAFTVPKDLSGKKVVMQGMAYRELTSVESLQAAAREAGKSQAEIDAIQQPTYEVSFEASGLKIVD